MPEAISSESQIEIRGIRPPALIVFREICFHFVAAGLNKRPDRVSGNWSHRNKPFRAGATQQIHQEGFHTVIARMSQRNFGVTASSGGLDEELPPGLPPCRLQIRFSPWERLPGQP